jgi:hypothetical protein
MATKTTAQYYENYAAVNTSLFGNAAKTGSYTRPKITSVIVQNDTFSGDSLPRYRSIIEAGANATTSASGFKYRRTGIVPQQYVFGYNHPSKVPSSACRGSGSVQSSVIGFDPPPSGNPADTLNTNKARSKFSGAVERTYTQFQGGVFLGELRETLHMIRKPAQALRKAVGSYLDTIQKNGRSLKRKPRADRSKWISGTYLEYAFGWAPLLSDLDDARSYLSRRRTALSKELIRVSASSHSPRVLLSVGSASGGIGLTQISYQIRDIGTYDCVLSGAVSSTALGQGMINASAMGLSPRHFAPTLWELLPWSFVIDYFSNVGDVIQGWSNQALTLAWGRETRRRTLTREFFNFKFDTSLLIVEEDIRVPGNMRMDATAFSRSPINSPPVPGLYYEIPGFGIKWLNMGALAAARTNIRNLRLWD